MWAKEEVQVMRQKLQEGHLQSNLLVNLFAEEPYSGPKPHKGEGQSPRANRNTLKKEKVRRAATSVVG
jgi:hypothetical protein